MVNAEVTHAGTGDVGSERALAVSYAPYEGRAGLAALLALDETLGQILRTTREPLVGQMRLTWWHQALAALDTAPPPAQPVLQALALEVLPRGVSGARLAGMIDGWEALLDPAPLDRTRLDDYATGRGKTVFEMAAHVLVARPSDPTGPAGAGWALADLALHMRDTNAASLSRDLAATALEAAARRRWSRAGRSLGALTLSARMNLATISRPGSPRRVARLVLLRLTGR